MSAGGTIDPASFHLPTREATGPFPKAEHILTVGEFRRVYSRGFHASTERFGCYVLPRRLARSRLGLSVSRKFGKAHDRNLIKRRLREAFRALRSGFPETMDIILVPRRAARDLPLGQVAAEMATLVENALQRRNRRRRP